MELPLGNFFQVSINSSKLFSFIQDISKHMAENDNKIKEISHSMQKLLFNLDDKLQNRQNKVLLQVQKAKRYGQQETNFLKLYMKDMDKKLEQKISDLQNVGVMLSKKILEVKENIHETTFSQLSILQNKVNNLEVVKQLQSSSNKSLQTLQHRVSKLQLDMQKINENLQENMRANQDILDRYNQQKHRSTELYTTMENSFKYQTQKRNKKDEIYSEDHINEMQSIQEKIKQAQFNIKDKLIKVGSGFRRSIIVNNQITKMPENKVNWIKKSPGKLKQLEKSILNKLNNIQEAFFDKLDELQSEQIKSINKNTIIDEHIGILTRKIQKQKVKINETISTIKNFTDKRVDDKVLQTLRNMIKKISKDLEQSIQMKINKDQYLVDKQKSNKKVNEIYQIVIQKAEKSEVKRGLSFLQQKIKEVIIVLTEQKIQGNKDGAIKRMNFKCLSCDKDLEANHKEDDYLNAFTAKSSKENAGITIRCQTNQIRKRKLVNNTSPTLIFDD